MRKAYGTLKTMNPSSPTYKKFIKFLEKLPKNQLKQLAGANIKFVSMLAKHRIKGESVKESHTISFTKDEMEKLHSDGQVVKADPDGKDHTYVYNESVTESIKVIPSNKIDSKTWMKMKYDLRDQFDELVKIGQDYGVFQNAQGTAKILKQIKRLMDKI